MISYIIYLVFTPVVFVHYLLPLPYSKSPTGTRTRPMQPGIATHVYTFLRLWFRILFWSCFFENWCIDSNANKPAGAGCTIYDAWPLSCCLGVFYDAEEVPGRVGDAVTLFCSNAQKPHNNRFELPSERQNIMRDFGVELQLLHYL